MKKDFIEFDNGKNWFNLQATSTPHWPKKQNKTKQNKTCIFHK